MSLGEQLKAIHTKKEYEKRQHDLEEQAATNAEIARKLKVVKDFFADVKTHIESAINAGRAPKAVYFDKRGEPIGSYELASALNTYQWGNGDTIANPKHEYHFAWKDFAKWATDNGLKLEIGHNWDGGGMESWNFITVSAA